MKQGYVYILSNKIGGTIYIGITSDLAKRLYEHKNKIFKGFAAKYDLDKLVYLENHSNIEDAVKREYQLKNWRRGWKIALIEKENPNWLDLTESLNYFANSTEPVYL